MSRSEDHFIIQNFKFILNSIFSSLDESGMLQVTSVEAVFEKNITVAEQVSCRLLG
jgi:hypothetical protein